jgi:hypothetical protein
MEERAVGADGTETARDPLPLVDLVLIGLVPEELLPVVGDASKPPLELVPTRCWDVPTVVAP